LIPTEADLTKASFVSAYVAFKIANTKLLLIFPPSVRKDRIAWNVVAYAFDQAEVAAAFNPQKSHEGRTASELELRQTS